MPPMIRLAHLTSAIILLICCAPALAADVVSMTKPANIVGDLGAMPAIASPADDAQRRINAAVKRLDDKVRKAAADCRKDAAGTPAGADANWSRSVAVTMHGPRFLSYSISDDAFCGGAHPNTSTMAIVYDLQTGQPVDWTKLLPALLTGKVTLSDGMDGTKMVTLSSPVLHALYLAAYRPRSGAAKKDTEDDECREAVASADSGPPAMMAWLDAKENGLAVQFDLAHVVQACADTVVIPAEALRALYAQPVLLDAITAAHSAGQAR